MATVYTRKGLFKVARIYNGEELYLTRYCLTPDWRTGVQLWLHVFSKPDKGRALHDHPFWFWTFVLWGGYREQFARIESLPEHLGAKRTRLVKALSLQKRDLNFAHAIVAVTKTPTVTLVLRGPYVRNWGFWETPIRWVNHKEHAFENTHAD